MVLPLPGALADFSSTALKAIDGLGGIIKAASSPQTLMSQNVVKSVSGSITSEAGNIFSATPGFVDQSTSTFLSSMSAPKSLATDAQTKAFGNVFGTGFTSGTSVDAFVASNVRLEDIIPAQQLFAIAKNVGSLSMYCDPLQAYVQVAGASNNLKNLCQEASTIVAQLTFDIGQFLSLQQTMDYTQIGLMNQAYFLGASQKAQSTVALYNIVSQTFATRGRYDAAQVTALCTALEDLSNTLMFANSKLLQLDQLRLKIVEALERLQVIGREIPKILDDVVEYVPEYVASALFGKLFQAVQAKVLEQSGIDLGKVVNDLVALSQISADDRAKLLSAWAICGSLQTIKALICNLQPSTEVTNPAAPIIGPIKLGYDALQGDLSVLDMAGLFTALDQNIEKYTTTMMASGTRDNTADLNTSTSEISGTLTALGAALTVMCGSLTTFLGIFATETAVDPTRLVGAAETFLDAGLGNAADTLQAKNFGDVTTMPLSESTKPGQLAESIREEIRKLPDGHEKDQLVLLHSEVYARHRATVLSMDLQRREDVRTFLAPDEEEANRQLVNKTTKTFASIDEDEYDQVLT